MEFINPLFEDSEKTNGKTTKSKSKTKAKANSVYPQR